MKNFKTVEYDLPIYWNCYIYYGDESGLEDGEKETIDEILEQLEVTNCLDIKDNTYFSWGSWFMPSGMGGDYCTYVFEDPHTHIEDPHTGNIDNSNINNQLELFTLNS